MVSKSDTINNILNLYKKGKSLNEISRKLGLPKTTIYYHTRKTFGRYYKEPYFNSKLEAELGEFVGAFVGDGNFYHTYNGDYQIRFFLGPGERGYANRLSRIIYKLFKKNSSIWYYHSHHLFRLTVYGKHIYKILEDELYFTHDKSFTVRLRKDLSYYSDKFLRYFVGGLISTDGTVSERRVLFYTISPFLAIQYRQALKKFGIETSLYARKEQKELNYRTCYNIAVNKGNGYLKLLYKKIPINESNKNLRLGGIFK